MTTKAVVLAAGQGNRLQRLTNGCTKCLMPVAGKPLIHHTLGSLARAGVEEVVIVVGHRGEHIEANLGDGRQFGLTLHYVWNREFERGNASSLWRALPAVESEPFLLVMADHICSATLYRTFLDQVDGQSAIAVDRSDLGKTRTDEATKVAIVDGLVVSLGKGLDDWGGIDTGVSHWSAGAFGPGDGEVQEGELAALMSRVARNEGGLAACDVSGHFWLDVDTEEDLRLAESLLRADEHCLA